MPSAMLLDTYNPTVFEKIPHFDDQVPKLQVLNINHILDTVGPIFAKHGVHTQFGLVVVHRHFTLSRDEILVEIAKPDGSLSVAMPWILSGDVILGPRDPEYLETLVGPGTSFVQSIKAGTWAFGPGGELLPFEFGLNAGANLDKVLSPPKDEFVLEIFQTLKKLGLQEIFGLRRHAPKSWETTIVNKRTNVTHVGDTPTEISPIMVTIAWTFNENGKSSVNGDCGSHQCCGHGGGCGCHR